MIRFTISILIALAIVTATAIWFSDRPGEVSIEWQGWLIKMSVGRFVLAASILLVATLLIIGLFRVIGRAPRRIRESLRASRRERGYRALTHGMVAVAAGDPDEANHQARRADALLNEPPLTMLLSAQAAQLNGDEEAATRYFSAMLKRPETAFLGVRGLLIQAQKNNDQHSALEYIERAYQLQPKTPWVLNTMFDLQIADGLWRAALSTLEEAVKRRAVTAEVARDRRATVLLGCSSEAEACGDLAKALKFTKRANTLAPEFLPAILRTADLMVRTGQTRPATRMIQDAWGRTPHPDLARLYGDMDEAGRDPLKRVKRLELLLSFNLSHRESHIALAEAALTADLWGEARNHLEKAAGEDPPARVCRMMADLEERSGQNPDAVRGWLRRASDAPPDPAWVCHDCGGVRGNWTPVCGNCQTLGTLIWEPPARAPGLSLLFADDVNGTVLDQADAPLPLQDEISGNIHGNPPDELKPGTPAGDGDTGDKGTTTEP